MKLKPELQVSVATAQSIVDAAGCEGAVATISMLHSGEIAAVYDIGFAVLSHRALVLKVYPDDLHWKMQKEVTVIGLVEERLRVPPPKILFADDSKRLLGLNFIVMTKLDGSVLGEMESTLASAQRASAYAQIGRLLADFHCIPMEAFGYIGPKGIWTAHATNRGYLAHQFQRKLAEFGERGGDLRLAERIKAHVAERSGLFDACRQPVLCHNDLHAGNLLATISDGELQLTGVLDFEGALSGDPLMDVAKALYYLDEESRRAVLDGYGAMGRDHWSETLALYHLYFVLELWCWMAQIGKTRRLAKLAQELVRYSAE
ncbi:aminoglycoside phosphotransferase family protein [Bradyrhizobium sp.]|uniref:phosphotransferase family protein n=1 Tax=Bradyrhizobium sp. TaxID=376 RepID=UPI001EC845EF|nr:aminoglycoside phosphotransferase family protein [Bradyrhizobium sp.]MBV9983903.1 aminoglycoside phosphotransferase family protein [Bradyrhizobium sp.]